MHFTEIAFRNFGPFENLYFELKQGSIGITGRNGSGKTTILNGMYGCVTNDFGRFDGVKADCIRNTAEPKTESYVHCKLKHNEHILSIKRGLYPAKTSVIIDNNKEITDAYKAQEEIYNILGMNCELLSKYIFKPQDGLYDFISNQPAERAKAFAVLCRTEKCEAIWDFLGKFLSKNNELNTIITDNSDELLTDIAQLKARLTELEVSIISEQEHLLNLKSEQSAREILRKQDRLEDFIEQRTNEQKRLVDSEELLETSQFRLSRREKKYKDLKKKIDDDKAYIDDMRIALKEWQQYAKQRQRRRQLEDEFEQLKIEDKQHQPPDLRHGDASIEELRHYLTMWKQQLKSINSSLTILEETGLTACPVCNTSVANLHDYINDQKELQQTLPKDIETVKKQIEEIEQYQIDRNKWEKWNYSYKARFIANQQAREALSELTTPDGNQKHFQQAIEQYDSLLITMNTAKENYENSVLACKEYTTQIQQSKRRLAEIADSIEENTEPGDKVDRARRRLEEHLASTKMIANLEGQLKGIRAQIADKETDFMKLKTKLKRTKKIRNKANIVEQVRELMHRNNLPRLVAQENLTNMEGDINNGLSAFGNPFWIESDDNLTFIVHKPGEPPQPAARLSTGQRVVLALSFWTAVASLWSHDLGMLALDEPTANLDEDNRKFLSQALGILTAKVRGRRQLIMVTHDPNLRNAFDQVIDLSD